MEIVRCEKGHFYDAEQCSCCPTCAKEGSGDVMFDYGKTEPIGATMPADNGGMGFVPGGNVGATQPAGGAFDYAPTEPGFGPQNGGVADYTPTMPIAPVSSGTENTASSIFNPIVGWLVCIEGPDKGADYRIYGQYNFIGRAMNMDICIRNDNHISNEKAAVVAYDPKSKKFLFAPGTGHNLVYVNDEMIAGSVMLKPYDELTIGVTKLLFVPLCGERFDWNDR